MKEETLEELIVRFDGRIAGGGPTFGVTISLSDARRLRDSIRELIEETKGRCPVVDAGTCRSCQILARLDKWEKTH